MHPEKKKPENLYLVHLMRKLAKSENMWAASDMMAKLPEIYPPMTSLCQIIRGRLTQWFLTLLVGDPQNRIIKI